MRARFLLFLFCIATMASAFGQAVVPGSASPAPAPQEPEVRIRTYTKLVEVPVIVTDGSGNPVRGLTKEDFQIFDDKAEKKIATFEYVTAGNAPLTFKALPPGTYSNLVMGEEGPRVITVVVMDAINTAFLDQSYARRQMIKYLATKVQPGNLITLMVLTRSGVKVIHEYTTDTTVLIKALERMKPGSDSPSAADIQLRNTTGTDANENAVAREARELEAFQGGEDFSHASFQRAVSIIDTIDAMEGIANSLAGIPGRKALLWATGSFPFYFDDRKGFDSTDMSPRFARLFQKLNDANIAIYPIDVRGLVNPFVASPSTRMGAAVASAGGVSGPSRPSGGMTGDAFANTLDTLRNAAQMTGGVAYYNTNDIAESFRKAAADSSTYYVLGYYLSGPEEPKSTWHKITVKTKRSGLRVRARKGVFATPVAMTKNAKREDLRVAERSPLMYTALGLLVKWPGYDAKAGAQHSFEMHLDSSEVELIGPENEMDLDFMVVARTADGTLLDQSSHSVSGKVRKLGEFRTRPLSVAGQLKLNAAPATVRFIVRDNNSGKMGSVIVTTPSLK